MFALALRSIGRKVDPYWKDQGVDEKAGYAQISQKGRRTRGSGVREESLKKGKASVGKKCSRKA